jgi:hypothetical protein
MAAQHPPQHRKDHEPADAADHEKAEKPAPEKPSAALPPSVPESGDNRAEYRPSRTVHIAKAGPVALGNWVGRVGSKFVRVYRGAQAGGIPDAVKVAMAASGIDVGTITLEELGLRQAPADALLSTLRR